ncbi:MAG: DUF4440 domain-containing protein [Mesorhizobium sp.]|uniref:YybH family protein n=1 Tax=Mesorhizobium sp. TaxID=1871066 RepID=UPI000FE46365|nr:DUF4440 domain-containing protein [Mesorhizobium sp.]RWD61666.1 MAG: DUF4440 domain-containing protein [Mesorhizobium sp.]RWE41624.1 MAG: DUF4440 domain-containing protein [Mesorhizobium sp.]
MSILEQLQSVYDAYATAYRNKDPAGCAAVFTHDGEVFSPYAPPAKGRAAIEALHSEWVNISGDNKELRVLDAGFSGDLAWCLTAYSDTLEAGTSLNVFQRQADGQWLIRACSLNQSRAESE